jgi:hypothetical protein
LRFGPAFGFPLKFFEGSIAQRRVQPLPIVMLLDAQRAVQGLPKNDLRYFCYCLLIGQVYWASDGRVIC